MNDLLEDKNPHSPQAVVTSLTRGQLGWTIAIACGLWMANLMGLMIADSIAPEQEDKYQQLREIVRSVCFGLMMAQLPMVWIWLRIHVVARSIRIVVGWIMPHLLVISLFTVSVWANRIAWHWEPLVGTGLTMYIIYLMTGLFTNIFASRCGLGHLWAQGKQFSQFAIGDLLSITFVAAMLTGELMLVRDTIIMFIDFRSIIPLSMFGFVAMGAATVATLALGCFYSPRSSRFIVLLGLLVLFGPSLVFGLLALFTQMRGNEIFITANAAIWTFAATLMLLFPTLPKVTRLSQP